VKVPLRSVLERSLSQIWKQRGIAACLLLPMAALMRVLLKIRHWLYAAGHLQIHRFPATVVVVGNAVVGGAGKTPTVIALVNHWQAQSLRVGVVSAGYGRNNTDTLEVHNQADVHAVGDEPLLIRQRCAVPVFVGRTRALATAALLTRYPQTQIVVCDDGLQHYALYRDLEICVFDDRGLGNGWVLPAGPLRAPWPRQALGACGQSQQRLLTLHTGSHPRFAGFAAHRHLADYGYDQSGQKIALHGLHQHSPKPLFALAGIAQPENFFAMLRAQGMVLAGTLALPDHFDFKNLQPLQSQGYQLLCTEKDAYKLWSLDPCALAIPLEQTGPVEFWQAIDQHTQACLAAKLPSHHGHTAYGHPTT
jgi:tetraacyldisaccharide 4'-kinase